MRDSDRALVGEIIWELSTPPFEQTRTLAESLDALIVKRSERTLLSPGRWIFGVRFARRWYFSAALFNFETTLRSSFAVAVFLDLRPDYLG